LTLAQLQARSPCPEGLRVALDAEVATGRARCENGVYSIITEAFPRQVLAGLLALTEPSTKLAVTNGTTVQGAESREQLRLAADLAALLAEEPFGLPCKRLALRLHRRLTDVLAALNTHDCFEREGKTRGARWRLVREKASLGSREGMGWNLRPPLDLALGLLVLDRLEAAERELVALKASLRGQEKPAA
jgi:hypothetical protein